MSHPGFSERQWVSMISTASWRIRGGKRGEQNREGQLNEMKRSEAAL